jgi:membrane-bound lytic murein transglycosylase D
MEKNNRREPRDVLSTSAVGRVAWACAITLSVMLAGCQTTLPVASVPAIPVAETGDDRYAEAPFAPTESLMLPVIREPGFELQGLDTRAVDADEELDLVGRIRSGLRLPEAGDPALDAELNWFVAHPDYLDRVFSRSQSYLFYIVEALEHRDLPLDLALLPIVESAFDPFAYSHGRAAGLWQIIPGTGRRLGLKQNWWFDARRDVPESTRAALDYLQYLNDLFEGDWLLAVAGYNSGEGNVTRAIRQAQAAGQPTDFWHIKRYLPRETRTYVPRLLALSQLIAAPHAYDLRLPVIPNEPYFTIVETDGQIDMALAAELANLTTEELYRLNPGVNRWATDPDGPHRMLVPVAHASGFATALLDLGAQDRVQWSRHSVQAGDTLGELAFSYRTTPSVLRQVNGLGSDMIRIGQNLMVPHAVKDLGHYTQTVDARAERIRDRAREGERGSYVVQAGDSLWSISRRYDVGVRELARWNAMAPGDPLQVGRQLVVWTSKSALTPTPNERIRRLSYTVRKGDSLYLISARFRVSVTELLEWNDLSSDRYLQPGQQLIMYVDVTEQTS